MRAWMIVVAGVVTILAAGLGLQAAAAPPGGGGGGGGSAPSSGGRGDPARNYQEGVAALQAGDYALAVRKLRDVAAVAPRDPDVNYVYALALIGNGDERQARRPLRVAIDEADTVRPDARLQLGLILIDMDEREDAMAQLTALAQELAACDAACGDERRAQLQNAYDRLNAAMSGQDAPEPSANWRSIPGAGEGRTAYAYAVGLINAERFEDALLALDRAQFAIGPHPDILTYRGFASRKLGRYDAALEYYAEALALDPNHIGANEYLGELYLEMGRLEDAERQLARLDALCPYGCAEREELARWIQAAN